VTPDIEAAVAEAFREEWGRVVATLIGLTGDWDLAEECAQDAFARALVRWPRDGVPRNPGLVLVDDLERSGALDGYHLLPATRADLLRRLERHDEAAAAYRAALARATSDAERRYLERRLAASEQAVRA
jgi:predicted RNA polymerase sigma factor